MCCLLSRNFIAKVFFGKSVSGQKYAAIPSVSHPTISPSALYQLCVYTTDTSSVNFQSESASADISRLVSNVIRSILQSWCAASGMTHRGLQKLCRIWVGLGDPPHLDVKLYAYLYIH